MCGATVLGHGQRTGPMSLEKRLRGRAERRAALVLARSFNSLRRSAEVLIGLGLAPDDGLVGTCLATAALLCEYYDGLTTEDDKIHIAGTLLREDREQTDMPS